MLFKNECENKSRKMWKMDAKINQEKCEYWNLYPKKISVKIPEITLKY